jgi:hypothetical protein
MATKMIAARNAKDKRVLNRPEASSVRRMPVPSLGPCSLTKILHLQALYDL